MRLTRGGATLLILILFALAVATPGSAPLFIVLACMAALLAVNVPCALLAVRGVSVRRDHPSHAKEGAPIGVRLHVTNHSGTGRVLLRLYDSGPAPRGDEPVQIPLLPGRRTETVSYTCNAGRRGVYRFRSCRVESSSPFGLVNARRRVRAESELVVYPLYYELMGATFPFHKSYSGLTAAPGSRPGEGPSFFGLREYRPGDPIRKIHWPSTVRARTVMVKEFEEDMHSSITILLDNYRPSVVGHGAATNLETAVRAAASLANYTLVNGHPTTLMSFDAETQFLRIDRATGDLTPVLDGLARLGTSTLDPAELVRIGRASAEKYSNWIVILLAADRQAMADLLRLRAQGIEIVTLIVDAAGEGPRGPDDAWLPAMLNLFDAAGIGVILMTPAEDLQAKLSRNLRRHRRIPLVGGRKGAG
ncbi:MAG: DUF58 domain-containing protein [Kiritimatiellae bacterium]|nr:DUF58 domain-containing protein [Kiritimatiellia bacterium]